MMKKVRSVFFLIIICVTMLSACTDTSFNGSSQKLTDSAEAVSDNTAAVESSQTILQTTSAFESADFTSLPEAVEGTSTPPDTSSDIFHKASETIITTDKESEPTVDGNLLEEDYF